MKRLLSAILASLMLLTLAACGGAPDKTPADKDTQTPEASNGEDWPQVTLVLGHASSEDSAINDDAEYIKDAVAKATNGTVNVEIYSGSTLGTEVQMFEGMQAGTVDMMIVPPSILVSFISDFGIFELPYLVQGFDHAKAVWDSEVGHDLDAQLNDRGVQCFGLADFGYRNATNSVRPITTPADVKGLKMRTMTSEVAIDLWKELGAEPIAMSINEVFSALQTKVIDGQENPYTAIQSNGFYEVQKYCSATQHQYNMLCFLVSDSALAQMTEAQMAAFISAFDGAEEASREIMDRRTEESVAFMKEKGMEFNDVDLGKFIEAAQPVIEKYADQYGRDKIELVQSLA